MASGIIKIVDFIVANVMKALNFFIETFFKGFANVFFSAFTYLWRLIKNLSKIMR